MKAASSELAISSARRSDEIIPLGPFGNGRGASMNLPAK